MLAVAATGGAATAVVAAEGATATVPILQMYHVCLDNGSTAFWN